MQISGQQLISRATYVSNRSLVAVCATVLLSHYNDLDLAALTVLGVTPGTAAIETSFLIFIVFLGLNHSLSWWADLRSFQEWNSGKNVGGVFTFGNSGTEFQTAFHSAIIKVQDYQITLDDFEKRYLKKRDDPEKAKASWEDMQHSLKKLSSSLEHLSTASGRLGWHAWLYLWGWFLVMPAALTFWALYVLVFQENQFPNG